MPADWVPLEDHAVADDGFAKMPLLTIQRPPTVTSLVTHTVQPMPEAITAPAPVTLITGLVFELGVERRISLPDLCLRFSDPTCKEIGDEC